MTHFTANTFWLSCHHCDDGFRHFALLRMDRFESASARRTRVGQKGRGLVDMSEVNAVEQKRP